MQVLLEGLAITVVVKQDSCSKSSLIRLKDEKTAISAKHVFTFSDENHLNFG